MSVVDTPTEAYASVRPGAPKPRPPARRATGQGVSRHTSRGRDTDRTELNRIAVARTASEHRNQPLQATPVQWGASLAGALLDRGGLIQLLDSAVTKRVTLISAPAGSGKTSLLRTWADRSTNSHRVAYVSIGHNRESAPPFWCAVLDSICGQDGTTEPDADRGTAGLDGDRIANRVLAELADSLEPLVLVIDDLHELGSAEALIQLDRFLARLPDSARVVLSSRRVPRIRLHHLRLAGEVAEIRDDDLRFTEYETRELLAASGITLSDSAAAALHRRTEGWAAGLRLAVISLGSHPDPERFVAEFSGADRAVGEYLIAEVLDRQPSDVRSMLLRTSLVDRVNRELADLLAGSSGSERILLDLEEANAFVVSLDAERSWFRYHRLLADLLRLELRRTRADELPGLHRRAAKWFADHGEVADAVRQMLAAGDWPDAARYIADHVFSLTLDGQHETIAALLASFPQGAATDDPELALPHAATYVVQGRLQEAAAKLALAASHAQTTPPQRRRRLEMAIAGTRLALTRRAGQLTQMVEQVNLLASPLSDEHPRQTVRDDDLWAFALMNLGIVEMWSGLLPEAERHLFEAAGLAEKIGRPYVEATCRAQLGLLSARRSFAVARERSREAISLAERHGWENGWAVAPALATLGATTIWMGEFDAGERLLSRAWKAMEGNHDPATKAVLHTATGMLHGARGQAQRALDEFEAAEETQSRLGGEHHLAGHVSGWVAATLARAGRPDDARAYLEQVPEERANAAGVRNARAMILVAEGNPSAALDELQVVLAGAATENDTCTMVETHLLEGLAHLELGARREASAAIELALAAAEADRIILPFALTASLPLLESQRSHETAHRALLIEIVDVLSGAPAASAGSVPATTEELSPSELRVLRFLPTNLTRSEIAGELYLSVHTVNTHIRSIYSKLGARDRSSAVLHARDRRLLATARL